MSVHIVLGFLPDNCVDKARIETFPFCSMKDDPIERLIARAGNIKGQSFNGTVFSGRRQDWTRKNTCKVGEKKKKKYCKGRELARAQTGSSWGQFHSAFSM